MCVCGRELLDGTLTANAVDHEWVQLLLAMLALAGQVRDSLHLTVKQVVQQGERHLLRCAAVTADVQHVAWRHRTANARLWVIFVPKPRSCRVVLCTETHKRSRPT